MSAKKYLVLSGGSMRGYALPPVLHILEEWGHLKEIHTFAGTSIGGCVAGMLALGYSAEELHCVMQETAFDEFIKEIRLGNIFTVGAAASSEWLQGYLGQLIERKFPERSATLTLGELLQETGRTLELSVLAKKVHGKVPKDCAQLMLNPRDHPDMTVILALRMTSALPGLQEPICWNGYEFEDGGAGDNYPISYYPPEETLAIHLGRRYAPGRLDFTTPATPPSYSPPISPPTTPPSTPTTHQKPKGMLQTASALLKQLSSTLAYMMAELEYQKNRDVQPTEIIVDLDDMDLLKMTSFNDSMKKQFVNAGLEAGMNYVWKEEE